MQLDYKDIIIKHYALSMSGSEIARQIGASKSELPDYEEAAKLMTTRKNMTLMFLWNRYKKKCEEEGARFYQYSQYCELYNKWCEENYETAHFDAVIAQKMEVDFAGQTFSMTDSFYW